MKSRKPMHDDWATPPEFYQMLDHEFHFDFDPCPLRATFDGLAIEWGRRNFVNPPYSRKLKEAFIHKALDESRKGKLVVMLLPVSTSTRIFHEIILPHATQIRFVAGRLRFAGMDSHGRPALGCGMHDSMVVIFRQTITSQRRADENPKAVI